MPVKKQLRRLRIKRGIRKKISGTADIPRLSVFRSNKDIYAQLIDDVAGHTIVSVSSIELSSKKGTKTEISKAAGKQLAQKAVKKGISKAVFDRAGYLYHGRVKALAEGVREAGLKF